MAASNTQSAPRDELEYHERIYSGFAQKDFTKGQPVERLFESNGFGCELSYYDFGSTPQAGLAPSWSAGYQVARIVDDLIVRVPLLRKLSSNFEILAKKVDPT